MKKLTTTRPLPGGINLHIKTVERGVPDFLCVEATISKETTKIGYLTGNLIQGSAYNHGIEIVESSEALRKAQEFFVRWEEPLDLLSLNLSYPIHENRVLFLEKVFLQPKFRGQKIGIDAIREVVELCRHHYAIDVAVAEMSPLQYEKGGVSKYEFSRSEYAEDMRKLVDYYSTHLGPVAWAGDYMLLPSRGRIPEAMAQWNPEPEPQPPQLPKWFFDRECWLILSPGRTALFTTPPADNVKLPANAKMLHYIGGIEVSDFDIATSEGIDLLVQPSDLFRKAHGTLVARKMEGPKVACEIWLNPPPEGTSHPPAFLRLVRYKKGDRYVEPGHFHTLSEAIEAMCGRPKAARASTARVSR